MDAYDRVNAADLESRAMKLVLQEFLDKRQADAERLAKLDDILSRVGSLESSLKEKDRKIDARSVCLGVSR